MEILVESHQTANGCRIGICPVETSMHFRIFCGFCDGWVGYNWGKTGGISDGYWECMEQFFDKESSPPTCGARYDQPFGSSTSSIHRPTVEGNKATLKTLIWLSGWIRCNVKDLEVEIKW